MSTGSWRLAAPALLLLPLLLSACGGSGEDAPRTSASREQPQGAAGEVYRFAKQSSGAYFYTADEAEKGLILASVPDMRYEGVAFLRSAGADASPVYRFAHLPTGGYFYTANPQERDAVVRERPDMRFEGSTFSAAGKSEPATQPVFRLANLTNGAYLFTASRLERSVAAGMPQWRDEGMAFRAKDPSPTPTVAAGYSHSCASHADGRVFCWGSNIDGELGSSANLAPRWALQVPGISTAATAAAGIQHSCALLRDGTVQCWGNNYQLQLADGKSYPQHSLPTNIAPAPVAGLTDVQAISTNGWGSCALGDNGTVTCWGNGQRTLSIDRSAMGASVFSNGYRSACSVRASGQVRCDGDVGTVDLRSITEAYLVSVGGYHACAALRSGRVQCWGSNSDGQLARADLGERRPPALVEGLESVVGIASGSAHTCALRAGGDIQCWGSNARGQLGGGDVGGRRTVPAAVAGISTARAIAAGNFHTCALLQDGTVRCWGANEKAQLGNAATLDTGRPATVLAPGGQGALRLQ